MNILYILQNIFSNFWNMHWNCYENSDFSNLNWLIILYIIIAFLLKKDYFQINSSGKVEKKVIQLLKLKRFFENH